MPFINLPPVLSELFDGLDKRLKKVEYAKRFTAPIWDFSTGNPQYPQQGDIFFDTNTNMFRYYNGSAWYVIADNNVATPVVSFTPTWSGTGLTFTGTPATGEYQKIGKQIHFQIKVLCTNVTNFGTGQYSLTLPFAPFSDYMFRDGAIHHSTAHHAIAADAYSGTTTVNLYHLATTNGSNSYAYDDPFSQGNPITLTTSDYFYVSGNYLTA